MIQKEAKLNDRKEVTELVDKEPTIITLQNGKKVKVGFIIGDTQDRLDSLIVKYEVFKKTLDKTSDVDINKGNRETRRFYAKCVAAILINNYILYRLFGAIYWRWIYHFGHFTGQDYLTIISEAKKKAQEQEYSVAMVLLMDMTTTWTTMTKKEAEEYRQELQLAREAQSLRNSQH